MSIFAGLSEARARLAELEARTRTAWLWDLTSGVCAGVYFGCTWTFVNRVARADLQATGAQMGWIAAAPALGYLFATLWARQMDGRAKMPFVFWTWLLARGLFAAAPLVRSRDQFVVLVCVTTLIFSVSTPAYTAIMKEIYPDRQRGRLMSFVRMFVAGTTLVTALVVGRMLDSGTSWQTVFLVGGAFGAMSAVAFRRIPVMAVAKEAGPRISRREFYADTFGILLRNPGYRWFTASVFVSGFGNLIATTVYPIHQVDRFHITNTEVANLQNIGSIATIGAFIFWGGYLDRRGPLSTVLLAICGNLVVPVIYSLATGVEALYLGAAIFGVAMAGVELGYLNTTLLFAEPGKAAQYQALHSTFFGLRGSIAPHCAIPLLHGLGPERLFLVAFGILLVGVGLQAVSMRDYRRAGATGGGTIPSPR
jgi:MFS family permease